MPDPDACIREPESAALPACPMTRYALMGALAYRATAATLAPIARYIARLSEQEFAVVCMRGTTARNPALMHTAAYQAWAVSHGDLLTNA